MYSGGKEYTFEATARSKTASRRRLRESTDVSEDSSELGIDKTGRKTRDGVVYGVIFESLRVVATCAPFVICCRQGSV